VILVGVHAISPSITSFDDGGQTTYDKLQEEEKRKEREGREATNRQDINA
jgi:hypothetical protein